MHQSLEIPTIHERRATSSSGAMQGQRAVAHPHRRVSSRRIDLQRAQNARGGAESDSSVSSRGQAEVSPYCRTGSTQKAMQRTMQACRVLTAATAAALALHTAPAYAAQASRCTQSRECPADALIRLGVSQDLYLQDDTAALFFDVLCCCAWKSAFTSSAAGRSCTFTQHEHACFILLRWAAWFVGLEEL